MNVISEDELRLRIENVDLRRLLSQAGLDAIEYKNVERLQRVLLEEMHHRIKNTLAVVIGITSQSLRAAKNLDDGTKAVTERLVALGHAHDLLLQANWQRATLNSILKGAIGPFGGEACGRFILQSTDIEVSAGAVLPLAMVLNELCTNAVKYGALSNATGQVTINASVDLSKNHFRLHWSESGGPPVRYPTYRSFGSKLIEHSFIRQLDGEAQLTFEPSGLVCVLNIPLAPTTPPQSN